ncbi:MAG: exodeoxyribonuclease VII large subunit [Deltaproteobacteria bacterium]|nr:exodeoxyribonuclease VII large subunit [Deltaproteobacteria bacterium]
MRSERRPAGRYGEEVEGARLLTVSELTSLIKAQLEGTFADLWVEGEVSNLRLPGSGHVYFSLKDEQASIRAVMFRNAHRRLRFDLEDGLHVVCRGRVSVYEPRGDYQLIVEELEPRGLGALQLAFEQLKARLQAEGLFDPARKRPLPVLPRRIAVVTSRTGAVIRDFLQILGRRFANLHVLVYPVRVQGPEAAMDIAAALRELQEVRGLDVIILARGGGSLEDLWPFNEEVVARAIVASRVPVVSAVGHEVDFTITDFVADLRAPTPSAAAELVVASKGEFLQRLEMLQARLARAARALLTLARGQLRHAQRGLVDPRRRLADLRLRVDDLAGRLPGLIGALVSACGARWRHLDAALFFRHPGGQLGRARDRLLQDQAVLDRLLRQRLAMLRAALDQGMARLDALSPLNILRRGYCIARHLPEGGILTEAKAVAAGDELSLTLAEGGLRCRVEEATG